MVEQSGARKERAKKAGGKDYIVRMISWLTTDRRENFQVVLEVCNDAFGKGNRIGTYTLLRFQT